MSVSRETRYRLYLDLLVRWTASIQLSSRAHSHRSGLEVQIADSLTIVPYLPSKLRQLTDLGSGQGFPAIPIAIETGVRLDMIEADRRKAAFLQTALATLGLAGQVHCSRIENTTLSRAECVTARALAPLSQLVELARPFLNDDGCCLFLKGPSADDEIAAASTTTSFTSSVVSRSDRSCLVRVTKLR